MEKVLIVDDEEEIIRRLGRILTKEGFEVVSAADGREGLDVFKRETPGLVITDVAMPEINGIELLHRIKKISPETEVIVVTGHGDYDMAIQVLRENALDYLKKPVDLDELLVAVGRYLEKSGALKDELARPNVLLLDDDEDARNSMSRYLKKEGYRVFDGADGEGGLEIFLTERIDVIVTDVMMPKMDGLALLEEIKKAPGETAVILITGYGNEEMVINAMREGVDNFLSKPVDIEHLVVAVDKAYEKVLLKRALARKSRDLELAQIILARLTGHGDLIVDLRDLTENQSQEIGQKLFDLAILPIVAVDKAMNCLYGNAPFSGIFDGDLSDVRTRWDEAMPLIGIHDLSYDVLEERILALFEAEVNSVEIIELSEFAYIMLTRMIVLLRGRELNLVSVLFRGERG
ncbi:MAG: response regulator [Desulfobacterales bacterium]